MKANVGGFDRTVRIVLGALLTLLAAMGVVGAWGWLGLVVLATGVFRFCGAYTLFGFSTCPLEDKTARG